MTFTPSMFRCSRCGRTDLDLINGAAIATYHGEPPLCDECRCGEQAEPKQGVLPFGSKA